VTLGFRVVFGLNHFLLLGQMRRSWDSQAWRRVRPLDHRQAPLLRGEPARDASVSGPPRGKR